MAVVVQRTIADAAGVLFSADPWLLARVVLEARTSATRLHSGMQFPAIMRTALIGLVRDQLAELRRSREARTNDRRAHTESSAPVSDLADREPAELRLQAARYAVLDCRAPWGLHCFEDSSMSRKRPMHFANSHCRVSRRAISEVVLVFFAGFMPSCDEAPKSSISNVDGSDDERTSRPFIPPEVGFREWDGSTGLIKGDQRNRIDHTTEYPWRATVALKWKKSSNTFCSGALVGPKHILTAAHCVVNSSNYKIEDKASMIVVPGASGHIPDNLACEKKNVIHEEPFGRYDVAEIYVSSEYITDDDGWKISSVNDATFDYALIITKDRVSDVGWYGFASKRVEKLNQNQVISAGYPGAQYICNDSAHPLGCCSNNLFGTSGKISITFINAFRTDLDIVSGQSGSPIFDANFYIVGVASQSYKQKYNIGKRINNGTFDSICDKIRAHPTMEDSHDCY